MNFVGVLMKVKGIQKSVVPKMASGFTLLELILASLITTIVVTITGIGLLNLSSNDIRNAAEKELINNFNRSSAFISDELRQAQRVLSQTDLNNASLTAIPSGANRVLGIINPNFTNPIVYYTLASPDKLIGPRVLYRYGPDFNDNGSYRTTTPPNPSDTTTWVTTVVTDLIPGPYKDESDTTVQNSLQRTCPCGWTRIPAVPSNLAQDTIDGFSVCVNSPSNNPSSPCPSPSPSPSPGNLTRVNLRIYGTVPLTITGTPRISYEASTSVFTRSSSSP